MNSPQIPEPKANILIVDDTIENLNLLATMLAQQGYKVRKALNGKMALMGVKAAPPQLILLDIRMPDIDGYQVCETLKADEKTREIPVIFLSALDDVLDKVKAFEVGGADYITKPFQIEEVFARVHNQLELQMAKAEICQLNAQLEQRVKNRTQELKAANEQLKYMALHDSLMGLPNRSLFMKRMEEAINRTKDNPDYNFAVLFLDCDRFKIVNDSLGHMVGDELLIAVAYRINQALSPDDILARFGGDEFMVLLEGIEQSKDATYIAQKIIDNLKVPFHLKAQDIFINVSIGIVLGTTDYDQPEYILRNADIAMYQAKSLGKARYMVFNVQMHKVAQKRLQLETDLQQAVKRQEFFLNYQPIRSLITGRIVGFEALVRWHHPTKGFISPGEFIPVAEETGLIIPIGLWVLREACQQILVFQNKAQQKDLKINVNLSVKQFSQPNLIEKIDDIIGETGINSQHLKLEITESAIMDNAESATIILEELRKRKIQLSIDDFGTGYSSLSYLHRFPVDTLKIDRSFISRLDENDENLEIVQAIITIAHNLGMSVTAEGIETGQQLAQLRALGCEFAQGYFFSKPLKQEAAVELIATSPQW
ncbi:MAG: EAL domain-containing protein [Moorea sp. SIO2B7]|nr:EAL domain-containing protein [Moorena sp. SIO2B7]